MTTPTSSGGPLAALSPLVGEWSLTASFRGMPPVGGSSVRFEWLPGEQFLIQRWEVPIPEAPDGIALIGVDPARAGRFLQHYFDTRGVARVYKMTLEGGVWSLWRDEPDFSPFDFRQRFSGTLNEDGTAITGAWEMSQDGTTWEHDIEQTYTRVR